MLNSASDQIKLEILPVSHLALTSAKQFGRKYNTRAVLLFIYATVKQYARIYTFKIISNERSAILANQLSNTWS